MAVPDLLRRKYGAVFQPLKDPKTGKVFGPYPDWKIEAEMYLCKDAKHAPSGWLGKAEHLIRMCELVFSHPRATLPFQRNPNIERIFKEYCQCKFLSCAGHGGSGKTEAAAAIAVAEFLIDPINTAVLVTSTTISDARGRIWGRIERYWQNLCEYFGGEANTPGKLVSSMALIRYELGGKKDDGRGIKLIPGNENEVAQGVGRMKGFHARRVRFIADELSDLSHKLIDAARSNLFTNPDFQMIGTFNPASYFDPAGVFSEPEDGWGSVNIIESEGWKTKLGYCIRFDGETSPNVLLQKMGRKPIYEGLLHLKEFEDARKINSTTRFMEQYRGCWSETGHEDSIYSCAEIINALGQKKVSVWTQQPTMAAGFDPSFSHGGDRAVVTFVKCGKAICNERDLPCVEVQESVFLDSDLDTSKDKKEQIIVKLRQECQKRGVESKHLAIDSTGAGDTLATLMKRDSYFSNSFMQVVFSGKPSSLDGKEKYRDMVSELWHQGQPLLRMGQLKGLTPDITNEMTKRLYTKESGGKKLIGVEPKTIMKARLNGRSPDTADSFFLALFVCRSRLGLSMAEKTAKSPKTPAPHDPLGGMFDWGKKKKRSVIEMDYVPSGGGFADESPSSNRPFGF